MDTQADDRDLVRRIRRLARALDVQSRRIDRETGLTLPQLMVLTALGTLGEVTSRALSAEADMSPPTVVGVLDKLAAKGLIERYRSERDRRIVHARLTERGRAALAAAPDPLGDALSARIRSLTAEERRAVVRALALLDPAWTTPDLSEAP
jgi:DNA-binding MarR family transcriptional regulator